MILVPGPGLASWGPTWARGRPGAEARVVVLPDEEDGGADDEGGEEAAEAAADHRDVRVRESGAEARVGRAVVFHHRSGARGLGPVPQKSRFLPGAEASGQ